MLNHITNRHFFFKYVLTTNTFLEPLRLTVKYSPSNKFLSMFFIKIWLWSGSLKISNNLGRGVVSSMLTWHKGEGGVKNSQRNL